MIIFAHENIGVCLKERGEWAHQVTVDREDSSFSVPTAAEQEVFLAVSLLGWGLVGQTV